MEHEIVKELKDLLKKYSAEIIAEERRRGFDEFFIRLSV